MLKAFVVLVYNMYVICFDDYGCCRTTREVFRKKIIP